MNAAEGAGDAGDAPREAFPALLPWLAEPAAAALALRARWPHALLITGPEGVGKRTLAVHFARALLCEDPRNDGSACGLCASCGYVAAGQHPDLRMVERVEYDDDGIATPTDLIRIDAIRALTEWTQITSHRRVAKVAVIVPAETMNAAASNALLKTLEEPPAGTFLLLVAHQPGRLPATIASRCRRHVVALPSADAARDWLSALGVRAPDPLLAQAGGAPLVARSLDDDALQAERSAWLHALAKPDTLSPVALAARLELGGRDQRRDRLAAAIDWLIAWTLDLARIASGGEAARNPDQAEALGLLGPRVARLALFRYHRQLLRQRELIAHPLQPRLVAEALLLDYRALF